MDYEQASIIGKRRRADAAMLLSGYVRERVGEVCAVKPAKDEAMDARDREPVVMPGPSGSSSGGTSSGRGPLYSPWISSQPDSHSSQ